MEWDMYLKSACRSWMLRETVASRARAVTGFGHLASCVIHAITGLDLVQNWAIQEVFSVGQVPCKVHVSYMGMGTFWGVRGVPRGLL